MRPKIVLLVMVVAAGIVVLAAVLKGAYGGNPGPPVSTNEAAPGEPISTNPPGNPIPSTNAAVLEQLRAKELAKELDQVRELEAQGPSDAGTAELLLNKVTSREPEVRKAAVQALVQLNATNVVPGLEQALNQTDDPREKAMLLDAINYLKLPEDAPPPPGTKAVGGALAPTPTDAAITPTARDRSSFVPKPNPNARKRQAPSRPGGAAAPPPTAPAGQ